MGIWDSVPTFVENRFCNAICHIHSFAQAQETIHKQFNVPFVRQGHVIILCPKAISRRHLSQKHLAFVFAEFWDGYMKASLFISRSSTINQSESVFEKKHNNGGKEARNQYANGATSTITTKGNHQLLLNDILDIKPADTTDFDGSIMQTYAHLRADMINTAYYKNFHLKHFNDL